MAVSSTRWKASLLHFRYVSYVRSLGSTELVERSLTNIVWGCGKEVQGTIQVTIRGLSFFIYFRIRFIVLQGKTSRWTLHACTLSSMEMLWGLSLHICATALSPVSVQVAENEGEQFGLDERHRRGFCDQHSLAVWNGDIVDAFFKYIVTGGL